MESDVDMADGESSDGGEYGTGESAKEDASSLQPPAKPVSRASRSRSPQVLPIPPVSRQRMLADPGSSSGSESGSDDSDLSANGAEKAIAAYPSKARGYIAKLRSLEADKKLSLARKAARAALERIPSSELNERRKVWRALLGLEIHIGTEEMLEKSFRDACLR